MHCIKGHAFAPSLTKLLSVTDQCQTTLPKPSGWALKAASGAADRTWGAGPVRLCSSAEQTGMAALDSTRPSVPKDDDAAIQQRWEALTNVERTALQASARNKFTKRPPPIAVPLQRSSRPAPLPCCLA
jgi:hypothetical protein